MKHNQSVPCKTTPLSTTSTSNVQTEPQLEQEHSQERTYGHTCRFRAPRLRKIHTWQRGCAHSILAHPKWGGSILRTSACPRNLINSGAISFWWAGFAREQIAGNDEECCASRRTSIDGVSIPVDNCYAVGCHEILRQSLRDQCNQSQITTGHEPSPRQSLEHSAWGPPESNLR